MNSFGEPSRNCRLKDLIFRYLELKLGCNLEQFRFKGLMLSYR